MKKILLPLLLTCWQTVLSAQEYFPEGTTWKEIRLDTLKYDSWYSKVGDEWIPNFETIEYHVKGDYTTLQGDKYRSVYTNGPEWTDSLTLLLQEENHRVSVSVFAPYGNGSARMLWPGVAYQFDWSVGQGIYYEDILLSNTTTLGPSHYYYGVIGELKEGYFGGVRPLKYVDLDGKAPDDEFGCDTNGSRIIQGIGVTTWNDGECIFGPSAPYHAMSEVFVERHYHSMLVHFERNGELLYDVWPVKGTATKINMVSNTEQSADDTLYDLQGRKLYSRPKHGLYVNNKKVLMSR